MHRSAKAHGPVVLNSVRGPLECFWLKGLVNVQEWK